MRSIESKIKLNPDYFGPPELEETLMLVEKGEEYSKRLNRVLNRFPDNFGNQMSMLDENDNEWRVNWTFNADGDKLKSIVLSPRLLLEADLTHSISFSNDENEPPTFYASAIEVSCFREEKNSKWAVNRFSSAFNELFSDYEKKRNLKSKYDDPNYKGDIGPA